MNEQNKMNRRTDLVQINHILQFYILIDMS